MYKFYKKSQNFRALSLSISRERDKNVRGFFGDFSLWVYSQQTCTFTMLTFKLNSTNTIVRITNIHTMSIIQTRIRVA